MGWLLAASIALASQIFYEDITLEELLQRDPIVAVVEPAEPSTVRRALPPGAEPPAMEASLVRLTVTSVVKAPDGLLSPGQVIEVADANIGDMYMLILAAQQDGTRRSPIYQRLEAQQPPVEGPQRIVLLRPCAVAGAELLCFAVDGAQLSTALLPAVTAATEASPPTP